MGAGESRAARLRLLLLVPAVLACALVARTHIRAVGHSYRCRLDDFAGRDVAAGDVRVVPEGMLVVGDVAYDGDVPVVELRAVAVGEGMVLVGDGGFGMAFSARVDPGLVIIVDGVNFSGWEAVGWGVTASFAMALALCAGNVARLWRRSWYGYDMAANAGGALFCAVEAGLFLDAMLSGAVTDFVGLALRVTSLADRFVELLLAPMALAALLVCASNVALARREGARPANLLGIAASLALALACVAWRVVVGLDAETVDQYLLRSFADSVVASSLSFAVALLAGTSLCAWLAARHVPSLPRDYLVILGCALMPDGSPTPLLAGRVEAALAFAEAQVEAGHPAPSFVASGGRGADERWSEAEAMRRHLVAHGVDEHRVLLEDRSTSTRENLAFSARVIAGAAGADATPRVAFATTNYHVLRGYVCAHDAGLAAEGIASGTRAYFWPNAFLREFAGLLAARALPIALACAAIALVYAAAEYAILLG